MNTMNDWPTVDSQEEYWRRLEERCDRNTDAHKRDVPNETGPVKYRCGCELEFPNPSPNPNFCLPCYKTLWKHHPELDQRLRDFAASQIPTSNVPDESTRATQECCDSCSEIDQRIKERHPFE